jgi:hypothetical protein
MNEIEKMKAGMWYDAKSQTTSSTGGLILPFKGMVLCVPLRHGSQHHWYYWLASLRRLIFILH